jgi:hypothetical protein
MLKKLTGIIVFAACLTAVPASAGANDTWKDQNGSTFQILATPGNGGEITGTITMAVPPAPGCNAVGVATPFLGYVHSQPKLAQVIIVNWTAPGCKGVTAWIGKFDPKLDFITQWTYADHDTTLTGSSTWTKQPAHK